MDYSSELESVIRKYDSLKMHYFNEKGRRDLLIDQKAKLEEALQKVLNNLDVLEQVRILLQKVSEYAREQSRRQIESLVTNCLQFIFDMNIEFKIEIEEVRGRPEAEFYVISNINGEEIKTKPQDARGGGVIDIISLAIRVAMLHCSSLEISGPLILDEPAKHVSEDYIIQVAEFLKQVSSMFDMQVIMVTHNRHLSEIANKGYRVGMIDGISRVSNDS
ncbi:ATPase [Clostridium thermosuccinogenes]|jgi:DNA repair exonuclease SbcCD ATPase subunit|uniref:ATPase n=1 Tax=Clostridium thermosuccinogenes TaxID=84032 RepID=A0A2K2F2L9_9CLOT|nr:ATPase [Pseudoclostridium thermosuccinogenes]AUS96301.1 ATPase [Pseudoclostridium thermosuccinogenes]PNT93027.1 ATPase [Pseudoclostridium thermosuccinogenes]PNT98515.1 ATPase [Pseudoclostridium thermosuccinogenes]PNU00617.1 ATPase [Pseudoclostridium thermosuccinogenes]